MAIAMNEITGMPAFCSYYPALPARYRGAQFQFVYFRADPSAVDRVLPECFAPSDDGYCVAIGLTVPWSANYGRFDESVLSVKCTYKGQIGYFAPVVFLNSRSSIPAGREIYGTPKVSADIEVALDERVMYTQTRIGGTSIFSIRSTMHREATTDDLPTLKPSWRLKVIPKVTGEGVDVMQLIDGANVTTDVTTHIVRAGDGVVEFHPSPIYDLSDFAPLEYYGAYYLESDYTENYGEIVRDFLKEK